METRRQHHSLAMGKYIKHHDWTTHPGETAMYVFTYRYTYQKLYTENFDMFFSELILNRQFHFSSLKIVALKRAV